MLPSLHQPASNAPNADGVRQAEAENNRLRREARKKASMHVRELVAFVKRRDPRVQAHLKVVEEEKERKAREYAQRKEEKLQATGMQPIRVRVRVRATGIRNL